MIPLTRAIFNKRMLAILFMGLSSGLPLLLIGATFKAWLHDAGVDITTIGLFAYVGLPYTLKFVWSPLMDRFAPPFLDRRRGWMLIWQICLLITISLMALIKPGIHTFLLATICMLIAFFSASQDIVIDAYRRDILSEEELGLGASLAIAGYRAGMLIASAGALPLADLLGWSKTYFLMALGMSIGIITSVLAPKVESKIYPSSLQAAIIEPFKQFFNRGGAWLILFFILFYKLGDQMATDLLNPFYLELGFTKTQIGLLGKTFGFSALICGGLLGGLLLFKLGIYRSLWIFGLLQMFSTLSFAWLWHHSNWMALAIVVTIENLASGMAGASYAAFIASLCDRRYTATQYALFSSLIGVTRVFFVSGDGWLVKHLGWQGFFILCVLLAAPGLILLRRLQDNQLLVYQPQN